MADDAVTPGGAARPGTAAAVSIGSAAVLLVHLGYQFEQYDQLQYLLLPYRSLLPDFAIGDWFTWQTSHYHVTFSWLVSALHAIAGADGLPIAMFVAHLGVLAWLGYAIFRLSERWDAGAAGACFAVLVFALIREKGIGGATVSHGHLLPSDLALPPLLLALAAWIGGRRRLAGLHLGLSGLLHANFAVLGPLVIAVAELPGLIRRRHELGRALRPVVEMAAIYLAVASPTLWMVGQAFASADPAPEAVDIIFRLRSPHHYALSAMSPQELWWPLLLLGWGLPAWRDTLTDAGAGAGAGAGPRRMIALGLLSILLLGLLGTLLSIGPVVRLFAWRLSAPALCILLLQVARSGRGALAARDPIAIGTWVAGLACASAFARSDLHLVSSPGLPEAIFALPTVALLTLAAAAALSRRRWVLPMRSVAVLLCVTWAGHAWAQPPKRHMRAGTVRAAKVKGPRVARIVLTGAAHRRVLRNMHRYARERTPVGSRFLIPPHMVDFRMASRRAVYVDFKAAPMRGDEALEWRRRMLAVAGVKRFDKRGYALRYEAGRLYRERKVRDLAKLARREGMDYLVARKVKRPGRYGLRKLFVDKERSPQHRKRRWVLYEVLDG